ILVPAGVAIVALQFLRQQSMGKHRFVGWAYAALILVSIVDLWNQARHFPWLPDAWNPVESRADKFMENPNWREICQWAHDHTPAGTVFITPRSSNSFKWYSGRDEAATWKDMPQDARSLVEWYHRLDDLFGVHGLRNLTPKYGEQYAVVDKSNLL